MAKPTLFLRKPKLNSWRLRSRWSTLNLLNEGYNVYVVEDACGATSVAAHDAVLNIFRQHGGAYGDGIDYAYTMVHKAPQNAANPHVVK